MASDDREQAEQALLRALQLHINDLKGVFEQSSNHSGFEDPVYRFYHQSFKVYSLQGQTQGIVRLLASLLPKRSTTSVAPLSVRTICYPVAYESDDTCQHPPAAAVRLAADDHHAPV
jgi:hypothetical protein